MKPLLLAIANPNKHAKPALDTLLQTVFINTVDAPSLALIVPVVHRGLRDRSGDAKKKAARIVGNMCALINEPKVDSMIQKWPCSAITLLQPAEYACVPWLQACQCHQSIIDGCCIDVFILLAFMQHVPCSAGEPWVMAPSSPLTYFAL